MTPPMTSTPTSAATLPAAGAAEIALLRDLVAVPSLSGTEHRIAQLIASRMGALGLASEIDPVGNVIVSSGATDGPEVVLLGHIDTVGPFLPVRETASGHLYGRGTVDAKGAMAVFLSAASRCRDLPIRIVVIGAVEEETSSLGARSLRRRAEPKFLVIGEPSGVDSVVIGYKGQIKGALTLVEEPAHAAGNVAHASHRLLGFWAEVEALCRSLSGAEGEFLRLTPLIRRIEGGQSSARLDFEIRLPPALRTDGFIHALTGIAADGGLRLFDHVPAVRHDRSTAICRAMMGAIRAAGLHPKVKVKTGTCDMNTVAPFWHSPAIAYGPGDSALDHRSDEHLALSDYIAAIDILETALRSLSAELAPHRSRSEIGAVPGTQACRQSTDGSLDMAL